MVWLSPVEVRATAQEKTQKARSSRHRASRRSSIGSSASSPPESHYDKRSSGAFFPAHQLSQRSSRSGGVTSRTATRGPLPVLPRRRMPRRSSTGYSETILAATASLRNRGPVTNVADADSSIFYFPPSSESQMNFDRMQILVS